MLLTMSTTSTDNDLQLLARYSRSRAEDAFAEIVRRYLSLVYSAALRQVRSPQLAEEVAQSVFTDLAGNAARLKPNTILTAWLYQVTHRTAVDVVRREARRQLREQIATEMNTMNATAADWTHIEPLLDEAMHALDETDRTAVLLRYFENKSLREVGATLGTSDDAAQKRVSRAVERLREFFAKSGVTVGASGLVVLISANAVQATAAGLVVTISAAALAGTAVTNSTVVATTTKTIVMTMSQKLLTTTAILALLATALITFNRGRDKQPPQAADSAVTPAISGERQTAIPKKRFFQRALGTASADSPERLTTALQELHSALYRPAPARGVRMYPPEEVIAALRGLGADRKEAFAMLREALSDPDLEVRQRAVAALGFIGMPARPEDGITGEPSTEAGPLLWQVLREQPELASTALSALGNLGFSAEEIPALTDLLGETTDQILRRYLPVAIADTLRKHPEAAGPFLSKVTKLLDGPDGDLGFAAACALAPRFATENPDLVDRLVAGLKNPSQELMAVETLRALGTAATPALSDLVAFANSTTNDVLRQIALKTIGKLNAEFRNVSPEVDQALRGEERTTHWNQKFASGNLNYDELLAALREPNFAALSAKRLGEMGAAARESVPSLLAALAGQDQKNRDQIVEAIRRIDPDTTFAKVEGKSVWSAAMMATLTLESRPENQRPPAVTRLLDQLSMAKSDWYTQQEILAVGTQLAAQDQGVYRSFAEKLAEADPALAKLFAPDGTRAPVAGPSTSP